MGKYNTLKSKVNEMARKMSNFSHQLHGFIDLFLKTRDGNYLFAGTCNFGESRSNVTS